MWTRIVKSLTRSPRGYLADGRTLGLGLATAMHEQRQQAAREVEDYLRTAPEPVRTSV